MVKNIRVVALDIDGTIFKADGPGISRRTKEAVQSARDLGVKVALCTGRWYAIMREFCHDLNMDPKDLHVTSNGSIILNTEGEVFERIPTDLQAVHTLVDALSEKNIGFGVCDALNFYGNRKGFDAHVDQSAFILVENNNDFKKLDYISKIYINAKEESSYVEKMIREMPFAYTCDFEGEFDVWPQNTNKGKALEKLAQKYNTDIGCLMFVGDGSNDLDALSMAGLGVAMGQSSERVKKHADVIAPSFSEDGAAWAIEEFILKKAQTL